VPAKSRDMTMPLAYIDKAIFVIYDSLKKEGGKGIHK
jgi:hypothetical protein